MEGFHWGASIQSSHMSTTRDSGPHTSVIHFWTLPLVGVFIPPFPSPVFSTFDDPLTYGPPIKVFSLWLFALRTAPHGLLISVMEPYHCVILPSLLKSLATLALRPQKSVATTKGDNHPIQNLEQLLFHFG